MEQNKNFLELFEEGYYFYEGHLIYLNKDDKSLIVTFADSYLPNYSTKNIKGIDVGISNSGFVESRYYHSEDELKKAINIEGLSKVKPGYPLDLKDKTEGEIFLIKKSMELLSEEVVKRSFKPNRLEQEIVKSWINSLNKPSRN